MTRAGDWAKRQLEAIGCTNVRLESFGKFGLAWTQNGASLELVEPGPGVFVAQALEWSPATKGTVIAGVVAVPELAKVEDFEAWNGKLNGKVILYGSPPKVNPDEVPVMQHADAGTLASAAQFPLDLNMREQFVVDASGLAVVRDRLRHQDFNDKLSHFLADQGAVAVAIPGGSGGVLHTSLRLGVRSYRPEHKARIPELSISDEAFGRMSRLLQNKVPVTVRIRVDTTFGPEQEGFNTLAEIEGTDPQLKDEVVMVGAHLDSMNFGTGATDDGAPAVVAIEAMRILKKLNVKPTSHHSDCVMER